MEPKYIIECLDCGPQEVEHEKFVAFCGKQPKSGGCPSCGYTIFDSRVLMVRPRMIWR